VIEAGRKSIGIPMHVISRKRLNEFVENHPDSKSSLARWYYLMKRGQFADVAELREVFASADQVGKLTVFDVGGNKGPLGGSDPL
jgi:mRNA interferase HigB